MKQSIAALALVVRDYDEAIAYYTQTLGFHLLEDTDLGEGKRWVLVSMRGLARRIGWPKRVSRNGPSNVGVVL